MANGRHLVIVGHGSGDPGAVSRGRTENAEIKRLINLMKAYSTKIDYIDNYNVYARGNIADFRNYNSITEFHLNAFNGQAHGTEVLIWHAFNADKQDTAIHNVGAKYFFNRGIKKRNNLGNMAKCSAVGCNYRLVEVCFIDSVNDMAIFDKNIQALAREYVAAIEGRKIEEPKREPVKVEKPKVEEPHWAEKHYKNLNDKGIKVHEKRFDEPITRGEVMALIDRATDLK